MKLYAFGSNSSGQLGIGHSNDTSIPQLCSIVGRELGETSDMPEKIVAGGNTTLILFASGSIYRAGINHSKPTLPPFQAPLGIPQFHKAIFPTENKAKLCSATWDASIVVIRNDEFYVSGRGSKGELGLGPDIDAADENLKIEHFPPEGTSVVDLSSSVSHTVAVLSNGEVYGWGNGRKGQLGEPADTLWTPRRVDGLSFKIVRAVCGREFTFLVGDSRYGENVILGSDKYGVKSQAPSHVPYWKDIGASWGSIFVLDREGKICSWGRNDWGQLGSNDSPPIESIGIGSEHVVALTEKCSLLSWGWGEHGNCGEVVAKMWDTCGSFNEIKIPRRDDAAKVIGVGAGCATSFFWTE